MVNEVGGGGVVIITYVIGAAGTGGVQKVIPVGSLDQTIKECQDRRILLQQKSRSDICLVSFPDYMGVSILGTGLNSN